MFQGVGCLRVGEGVLGLVGWSGGLGLGFLWPFGRPVAKTSLGASLRLCY